MNSLKDKSMKLSQQENFKVLNKKVLMMTVKISLIFFIIKLMKNMVIYNSKEQSKKKKSQNKKTKNIKRFLN